MSKIQKTALVCSILFCLNYALDILLGFDMLTSFVSGSYWLHKFVAFGIGVVGFLDILIFMKED